MSMFIPYTPHTTKRATGAVKITNKGTTTFSGITPSTPTPTPKPTTTKKPRLLKPNTKPLFTTTTASTTATTFSPYTDTAGNPNGKKKKTKPKVSEDSKATFPVRNSPIGTKFNLPPHKWSLPIDQRFLNSNIAEAAAAATAANYGYISNEHKLRRAIMWCYAAVGIDNDSYTFQGIGPEGGDSPGTNSALRHLSELQREFGQSPLDTNWGFQFLWNPEAIGNSLSRNANFTPSAVDKVASLVSLFTAMEAVSFKIVIDRVNDFACIKKQVDYQTIANTYYTNGYPGNPENVVEQVKTLAKLGTMADIEYIFKMINGEGTNGAVWKNALGRKTADLGFLSPTAVAVQFGPNPDSLSYVGYVDGITVSHNMFTEDMIPIHSEVTVNFVAFARTALKQK